MSKISIIIPIFNTEKWISRCLDSLIKQTLTDIEIICVNDGSTDNSLKILNEYAAIDNRIIVISQKNDKGPGKARNVAIKHASAPYIMFCDSDDWYEPNMCEIMYNTIKSEKVDVVSCHCKFEYENAATKKEEYRDKIYFNKDYNGKYKLTEKQFANTNVLLWEKIFRADIIKKYNIKFLHSNPHDDDSFWLEYAAVANSIYYIKDKLYHYFVRIGSIMSKNFKKQEDPYCKFAIADHILNFYAKYYKDMTDRLLVGVLKSYYVFALNELYNREKLDTIKDLISQINSKLTDMNLLHRLALIENKIKVVKINPNAQYHYNPGWVYM